MADVKRSPSPAATEAVPGDVFIVDGGVLKNPTDTTSANAPLYNVVGTPLGFTWGDWQTAAASSRVEQVGDHTLATIRLTGLRPNGVYSLFYLTFGPDSSNPLCPNVERALPLTAANLQQQPDASSFVADGTGNAQFTARVNDRLLDATILDVEVIFHDDGTTYGSLPNRGEYATQGPDCQSSYGEDAMRQLLIIQQSP